MSSDDVGQLEPVPNGPRELRSLSAAVLLALLVVAYSLGYQKAYWSDARPLLDLVSRGEWLYHHLAYLPVAQLFFRALRPFLGEDPEAALALLSALASAAAVWGVWRAALCAGMGRPWACIAALFLACTPTVLFYATTIEVHPLQMMVSAWGLCAAAREWTSGRDKPDALLPALLAVLLISTHMVAVLALPGLLCLSLRRGGRWRAPRRLLPALMLLALAGAGWYLTQGESQVVSGRAHAALLGTLAKWSPSFLLSEWTQSCGLLPIFAALVWVRAWRGTTHARDAAWIAAALVLPFLLVLPGWQVAERGGYLALLLPLIALAAANMFAQFGSKGLWMALALCSAQTIYGLRQIRDWTQHYRGAQWIEAFKQQADGKGLLLALDNWEMQALRLHSRLEASSLRVMRQKREVELNIQLPGVFEGIAFAVANTREQGGLAAMTKSLYDLAQKRPDIREFIHKLEAREGKLVPSAQPEFLVFAGPRPSSATEQGGQGAE